MIQARIFVGGGERRTHDVLMQPLPEPQIYPPYVGLKLLVEGVQYGFTLKPETVRALGLLIDLNEGERRFLDIHADVLIEGAAPVAQ